MDAQEPLIFRQLEWTPRLAAAISRAASPDGKAVNSEIVTGRAQAWEIEGRGVMVTRLELHDTGPELVVVAGEGRAAAPVMCTIPAIARANGARRIRLHSYRRGMRRWLRQFGQWEEQAGEEPGEKVFFHGV